MKMLLDQSAALDAQRDELAKALASYGKGEEVRNTDDTVLRPKEQNAQLSDAQNVQEDIAAATGTPPSAKKKRRGRRGKKKSPSSTPRRSRIGAREGVTFDDTPEPTEKGKANVITDHYHFDSLWDDLADLQSSETANAADNGVKGQ